MDKTPKTRQDLNRQQTELRELMTQSDQHEAAIQLFLRHHAMLHSARMAASKLWSYEDSILDDLSEPQFRDISQIEAHSLAWIIWHLARIEDITMNLLVAGQPQLFGKDNWQARMRVSLRHSGNEMSTLEIAELSQAINLSALRDYRVAVGQSTREIVQTLQAEDLKRKVDPRRLEDVRQQGAVAPEAHIIIDYWGRRTIAGLLLMPPTRHCLVHLNEAERIKAKLK